MYLYIPIGNPCDFSEEKHRIYGYGLCAFRILHGKWKKYEKIPNISLTFFPMLVLATKCTVGQLRPYQLKEVVEDFLYNQQ